MQLKILKNTSALARGTLLFLLFVVAWGAYVRASGSGAGCGSHWPLCNGQVIPVGASTKTLVEFTHRITSGFSLLLSVALGLSCRQQFSKGSWTRLAGAASVFFIFAEAGLGAGLVLLDLVEEDKSVLRTISLGVHLVNTFFLIASVTLAVAWSELEKEGEKIQWRSSSLRGNSFWIFSILGLLMVLVLGASGAMTALGDTLFPTQSVVDGLRQDWSPTSHFLIQLRVLHPLTAVGVSAYLLYFTYWVRKQFGKRDSGTPQSDQVLFWSILVAGGLIAQLCLGGLNILLLAPTVLQLAHLLVADFIWIALVSLVSAAGQVPVVESRTAVS